MEQPREATLTLARALAKVKRLDQQINEAVQEAAKVTFTVAKGDNLAVDPQYGSADGFVKAAKAANSRVIDLIAQRNALVGAIRRSNVFLKVKVSFLDNDISIAEAVEYRKSMSIEESLIEQRIAAFVLVSKKIAANNAALDTAIEAAANAIGQGQITAEMYDIVEKPRRAAGQSYLVDPLGLANALTLELSALRDRRTELDFTLSEVNARSYLIS